MKCSRSLLAIFTLAVTLACAGLPDLASEGSSKAGATGTAVAAGSGAPPPGVLRMKQVTIEDKQGYDKPVPAFSLLVPSDWTVEGGVEWSSQNLGCPENIVQPWAIATAPDGVTAVEILPPFSWAWAEDPMSQQMMAQNASVGQACPLMQTMTAGDFVTQVVVPQRRAGAQVLEVKPLPELAAELDAAWAPQVRMFNQAGTPASYAVDAHRVHLRYGQTEEWITATRATLISPMASLSAAMNGNYTATANLEINLVGTLLAVRAPAGQLQAQEQLLGTIMASLRVDPRWQAAITRFTTGIRQQAIKTQVEIARIYRETNTEIMESNQAAWEAGQRSNDEAAKSFSQYIREVDEWSDPAGGTVELDQSYDHAWSNGQGEYLLSQDANWEPNVSLGTTEWTAMERAP